MNAEEIRKARKSLGITQEQLAINMLVDVTTVQRWEAGRTVPSLSAVQRLKNFFVKMRGLTHPLMDILLESQDGIAILDENAVYRRLNTAFLDHLHIGDRTEAIGCYCFDVNSRSRHIWRKFGKIAQSVPEDLLFSDFEHIFAKERHAENGKPTLYIHSLTAIRQTEFSSYLLHKIEKAGSENPASDAARRVSNNSKH